MPIHTKRHKVIQLKLGVTQFECQVRNWQLVNNTNEGDPLYTLCPDGETREETDSVFNLQLEFYADWRSAGISDYLWTNDNQLVTAVIVHHPDDAAATVNFQGQVRLRAPSVGGEARTTEFQQVTFPVIGKPTYSRGLPV